MDVTKKSETTSKKEKTLQESSNWMKIHQEHLKNYVPVERYGHSAVAINDGVNHSMIIFGGSDSKGAFLNDVLEFDFEDMQFQKPKQGLQMGRHFHSAVVYKGKMYVFGGKSNGYFNDIQVYDIAANKWDKLTTKGSAPSPRYGHTAVLYNHKMWVFGGYDNDGFTSNELFSFTFADSTWAKINIPHDKSIPGRFNHVADVYDGKMYVFGGKSEKKEDGSIYEYDFSKSTWKTYNIKGPAPRFGHCGFAVNHPIYPAIHVHGGSDNKVDFGDHWAFNFDTKKWICLTSSGEKPTPRFYHSSVFFGGKIWFFGGRDMNMLAFNEFYQMPLRYNYSSLLPDEIYERCIFPYLDIFSLGNVELTCTLWRSLLLKDHLLWKNAFLKRSAIFRVPEGKYPAIIHLPNNHAANTSAYWKHEIQLEYMRMANCDTKATSGTIPSCKICIVGCGAVGKTCTLIRYTTNSFPAEYVPTTFDNYSANAHVNGQLLGVSLWDTSGGGEDYDRLRPLSYVMTDVFILLFSVISVTSYDNVLMKWYPEVHHHVPTAHIVVAANKIDLRENPEVVARLKEKGLAPITTKQGKERAAEINAKHFIEISAVTGEGVNQLFETCYELVLNEPVRPRKRETCVMQ